jgi:hypothetical protein
MVGSSVVTKPMTGSNDEPLLAAADKQCFHRGDGRAAHAPPALTRSRQCGRETPGTGARGLQ